MTHKSGAMHVVTTCREHKDKLYETHLLRRPYREDDKVKDETLGTSPTCGFDDPTDPGVPGEKGRSHHVVAAEDFEIERALPHGDVAALSATANKLALAKLLGRSVPSATSLSVSSSPGSPIPSPN